MPSAFSHIAVPLALGLSFGKPIVSNRLIFLSMFCSVMPDFDAVAFSFGIPYESPFGHRGFTHSIFFSLIIAAIAACFSQLLKTKWQIAFIMVFVSTVSHALLDAFTSGGLGVALWFPFSNERFFFPWRPIKVSPIGVGQFFSEWGLRVIRSELLWIWLPAFLLTGIVVLFRTAIKTLMNNYEKQS